MTQIHIIPVNNQAQANDILKEYPRLYPKRKIIGISICPIDFPSGWFMTITYEVLL